MEQQLVPLKIKSITITLALLIASGCSTISKQYNIPFINTDETITLEYGMDKSDVRYELGSPLYVKMGDKASGEIVWIYEVRAIEVKSDLTLDGQVIVSKTSPDTKHSAPMHRLRLVFANNKLISWGPLINDDSIEDIQRGIKIDAKDKDLGDNTRGKRRLFGLLPPKSKAGNIEFFFMPKASMLFENISYQARASLFVELDPRDDWGQGSWHDEGFGNYETVYHTFHANFSGPSAGVYLGIQIPNKIRLGLEIMPRLKVGGTTMGVLEVALPFGGLSLLGGLGFDHIEISCSEKICDDYGIENFRRYGYTKFGLARGVNDRISGAVEIFLDTDVTAGGNYKGDVGTGILFSLRF